MKLLKITTCYQSYLRDFYRKHSVLAEKSYSEQKTALDFDAFGWADYWSHALAPLGYDVMEVTWNVEPMQRAWASENSVPQADVVPLHEIVLAQVKKFKPEILWFDDSDEALLKQIRSDIPSIRLVLGWVGSAIPKTDVWRHIDIILSCAQESVDKLKQAGLIVAQMHHGFDPRINNRLVGREKRIDFSFIGQLIRFGQFHLYRERLLEQLVEQSGIEIFSPSANSGWKEEIVALMMSAIYGGRQALKAAGLSESVLRSLPVIGRATQWPSRPLRPVNPRLKPFLKPPVYGLDMFQVLRDSRATLNIHADSSPRFASNMRLFETTGVGTCLVTDWKENLHDLFEPDKEVVAYKTVDECTEKVRWLLDHPKEREDLARAGHLRTLREHTFSHRAVMLNDIIRKRLRSASVGVSPHD